jgi:hypothetical protein
MQTQTLGSPRQTCVCDPLLSKHSKETLFTALLNKHTLEKCMPVEYMQM